MGRPCPSGSHFGEPWHRGRRNTPPPRYRNRPQKTSVQHQSKPGLGPLRLSRRSAGFKSLPQDGDKNSRQKHTIHNQVARRRTRSPECNWHTPCPNHSMARSRCSGPATGRRTGTGPQKTPFLNPILLSHTNPIASPQRFRSYGWFHVLGETLTPLIRGSFTPLIKGVGCPQPLVRIVLFEPHPLNLGGSVNWHPLH